MAQLVLTAATTAISSFGPAFASSAASTIASLASNTITSLIFGPTRRRREGPRLETFTVQASTEGAAVLRTYGRTRIGGQVIWAANFRETVSEDVQSGKGARLGSQTTTVTYLYSISLAIGLCEGEIARVARVWADGRPFDLSTVNARVYTGTEDQMPDGIIEAIEGASEAPAFRGLAYIVFEDLPLADFGNRIPQFSFEIEKPLRDEDPDTLENLLQAVTVIPSSGEFVYGTTPVTRTLGEGVHASENVHNNQGGTDFTASMDALQAGLPHVAHTALVVAWFGDDLRAGHCDLRPGVETPTKENLPYAWSVGGQTRENAYLISELDGAPAYGGTPADASVLEALDDMGARGLKVMFHPFILMDVPPGNGLPNPDGNGTQSPFPWRGRITAGTEDGTPAARDGVDHFFGAASPGDFSASGTTITYAGPDEHSFRRMILHNAHLCRLANQRRPGTVEAFLIGSEMRGVTTVRDETGVYPAITHLRALAADVRSILGSSVAISYGADWSEYFGHQPGDGSRLFHLDPLWADENIDFIGIDNYMPLADWRPGFAHLDAVANTDHGPYALDYLRGNIQGGEGYDWFYASEADRVAQLRTPITDGAHAEPWIYRYKDLWNWWANPHHERPGGVRNASPTPWVPQSKPIRFTEIGCPAIDHGANQPNVFVDPKSVESAFPYFSNGARDDLAQRRLLEAHGTFWRNPDNNPISDIYGGPMVDAARAYVYAWDARPFPDFPARDDVWGDTENWTLGHWLNGRIGRAPLDLLVRALAGEADVENVDTGRLEGVITGYIVDRPLSPREMIDPLADIFQFDSVESNGVIRFQPRFGFDRVGENEVSLTAGDMIAGADSNNGESPWSIIAGQTRDLPASFRLGFLDEGADITPAIAAARDPGLRTNRELVREIPAVLPLAEAEARARSILADAWVMRERIEFSLPPSKAVLEPGDLVTFRTDAIARQFRIVEIEDRGVRRVEAVRLSPSVYEAPAGSAIFRRGAAMPNPQGPLDWALFELPLLRDDEVPGAPWFAAFGNPWPGGAALYRGNGRGDGSGDVLSAVTPGPAMIGRLVSDLPPAASGRWVHQAIRVRISRGTLTSRTMEEVFAGGNAIAVESQSGQYEVVQFQQANLITEDVWELSGLLRGQAGSEAEAASGGVSGARIIVLTPQAGNGLVQADGPLDFLNLALPWRAGPERVLPSDPLFTEQEVTLAGRNLKPLAPVHLRARLSDGDMHLNWIRRTRLGGDNWEVEEVPLGEAFERYRVMISHGDTLLRTSEVSVPSFLYAEADRLNDLAGLPADADVHFQVAQLSDRAGLGQVSAPIAL